MTEQTAELDKSPTKSPNKTSKTKTAPIAGPSDYEYMHSYTYTLKDGSKKVLEPIAVLKVDDTHPFPSNQNPNLVQIMEIGEVLVQLLTNITTKLTNLLDIGSVGPTSNTSTENPVSLKEVIGLIKQKLEILHKIIEFADIVTSKVEKDVHEKEAQLAAFIEDQLQKDFGSALGSKLAKEIGKAAQKEIKNLSDAIQALLKDVLGFLTHAVIQEVLRAAGLSGDATSLRQYADQFQTFVVPDVSSTLNNDDAFAAFQVSGPNPLVIERVIDKLPSKFPVDDESYRRIMGPDDSIELAIAENRLYLTDYKALSVLEPGTFPQQKYIAASMGLFAVKKGDSTGALKAVAIQVDQTPSANNPVLYPFHGETWTLAKAHFQAANANYHELISHLGLTHLLIEPFAVSTQRKLNDKHPIYNLLLPHFQGTLFINNAAILTLINPGGGVDRTLGGTIETDWEVTTNALTELNFNERMLPNQLAGRFMANKDLPISYPYRDDAMDVWNAIKCWAKDYVDIYYLDDKQVADDSALQAWLVDLTSEDGGRINGLGEEDSEGNLGIYTKSYLIDVLTMVIFTSSAQHAAVNFPQLSVMSYTPSMPLAAYAPAPTSATGTESQGLLATLPPLEQALQQQLITHGLGGVYFTRLGDYNRHQRGNYFSNTKVQGALETFRDNLDAVESIIGARNLHRPMYQSLLPSRIPQSINI